MAKYTYPAVFVQEEKGFTIYFPDIEGCYTQAEDLAEGIENASDALCLMLYELEKQQKPIPTATSINKIEKQEENFASMITCDTRFYKNFFEGKSVKVNTTIPLWLKEEAEKRNINFSHVLQNGLKKYLQMG